MSIDERACCLECCQSDDQKLVFADNCWLLLFPANLNIACLTSIFIGTLAVKSLLVYYYHYCNNMQGNINIRGVQKCGSGNCSLTTRLQFTWKVSRLFYAHGKLFSGSRRIFTAAHPRVSEALQSLYIYFGCRKFRRMHNTPHSDLQLLGASETAGIYASCYIYSFSWFYQNWPCSCFTTRGTRTLWGSISLLGFQNHEANPNPNPNQCEIPVEVPQNDPSADEEWWCLIWPYCNVFIIHVMCQSIYEYRSRVFEIQG